MLLPDSSNSAGMACNRRDGRLERRGRQALEEIDDGGRKPEVLAAPGVESFGGPHPGARDELAGQHAGLVRRFDEKKSRVETMP
jgi:hypothetical protein